MSSPPTDAEKEAATPTEILKWQVEALEGQADVQKVIGHADEAIKGYTQALELMATDAPVTRRADLYHKLATAYHDKGQFDAAQEAFKGFSREQSKYTAKPYGLWKNEIFKNSPESR